VHCVQVHTPSELPFTKGAGKVVYRRLDRTAALHLTQLKLFPSSHYPQSDNDNLESLHMSIWRIVGRIESVPSAGSFKQSTGPRNRVGIRLSYTGPPGYTHSLAELVIWNWFLGSLEVLKIRDLFAFLDQL
jgi:hypothetical protein